MTAPGREADDLGLKLAAMNAKKRETAPESQDAEEQDGIENGNERVSEARSNYATPLSPTPREVDDEERRVEGRESLPRKY